MASINNSPAVKKGLVLAAGLGKRLLPLTKDTPKPLLPVQGVAMLDRAISKLTEVGITEIIVNTHHHASQVKEHLRKYDNSNITLHIIHEEKLLDVGGSIMNAMQRFAAEPLLVFNSDVLLEGSLQPLLDKWDASKMQALLLLQDSQQLLDARQWGDFDLAENGKIIRNAGGGRYVWTGIYIMTPEIFAGYRLRTFYITEIVSKATPQNFDKYAWYGLVNQTKWLDIGNAANYEYANNSW